MTEDTGELTRKSEVTKSVTTKEKAPPKNSTPLVLDAFEVASKANDAAEIDRLRRELNKKHVDADALIQYRQLLAPQEEQMREYGDWESVTDDDAARIKNNLSAVLNLPKDLDFKIHTKDNSMLFDEKGEKDLIRVEVATGADSTNPLYVDFDTRKGRIYLGDVRTPREAVAGNLQTILDTTAHITETGKGLITVGKRKDGNVVLFYRGGKDGTIDPKQIEAYVGKDGTMNKITKENVEYSGSGIVVIQGQLGDEKVDYFDSSQSGKPQQSKLWWKEHKKGRLDNEKLDVLYTNNPNRSQSPVERALLQIGHIRGR